MYDLTPYDNITGLADLMIKLNTSSNGILAPFVMYAITIVLFLISRKTEDDFAKSALFASVSSVIIGMLFLFSGFLDWKSFIITLILVFASLMVFTIKRD